jgi:hypothetical protein
MHFSRRQFMKAGIVATACAGLPLKSVLADQPSPWQSSSLLDQLRYYSASTFAPYVNTKFRVFLGPSNSRTLVLTEVTNPLASTSQQAAAMAAGVECFSLLFIIPPGKPFTQETYLIKHDALGTFYMFVVPVGGHNRTSPDYYEAVVYRRQQYSAAPPVGIPGPATESVTVQAEQNRQGIFAAAPTLLLPGEQAAKRGTKEEREVYRFRPEKLEPTVDEQAKAKRVKKPEIYPMILAQAPVVNGLKLGMTPDQVLALFPGSRTDKDVRLDLDRPPSRFGVSSFTIRPEKYSSASKFEGITQLSFTLFDGRISTLYVGYDGPVWSHVDEFVAKFSEKRNLPAADSYWEAYLGMDDQLKTLKGKEVEISLFAGGKNLSINYVQMRDLVALKKFKERLAKSKE